jgi:hypothetical protein
MTELTEMPPQLPSNVYLVGVTLELAKCLKLVAPISMNADAQMVWLQAAADALDGIRADEIAAVSAELRRSVTRPSQIVPEISKLVAEKRARANRVAAPASPYAAEMAINEESQRRRAAVGAKDKKALSDIYEWERQARMDAGLHVGPYPKRLTDDELEAMPSHIRKMGIAHGFLEYRGGKLVEA